MNRTPAPLSRRIVWIDQNFTTARQAGNCWPVPIVAAFLGRGWAVDVVTRKAGYLDEQREGDRPGPLIERDGHLTIHRLDAGTVGVGVSERVRSYFDFLRRARGYLTTLGACDLVYSASPPLSQLALAVQFSVARGCPLVVTVCDLWPARLVECGLVRSRPLLWLLEWLEATAYRYADHCIAVAPAYGPYIADLGVPRDRVTVVPTGADPRLAAIDRREGERWRAAHGLRGRCLITYVGSFNEYYDLERVLAAAEQLAGSRPELAWVFAGNGRTRPQIEEAAGRLECIRYLGPIPRDDLAPLYAATDVALVPLAPLAQLETVIPGKLFDYLAAGLPVVSVLDGQTGAIVRSARAGIVLPEPTSAALASAVEALATLPAYERRRLGRNGQAWVLRHVHAGAMAQRIIEVVERLPASRGSWRCAGRLAAAVLVAAGGVLTRRSSRSVRRHFGAQRAEVVASSYRRWLAAGAAVAPSPMGSPERLSVLLSDWPRRTSAPVSADDRAKGAT